MITFGNTLASPNVENKEITENTKKGHLLGESPGAGHDGWLSPTISPLSLTLSLLSAQSQH